MSGQFVFVLIKSETKFADIKCVDILVIIRKWGEIPGFTSEFADFDEANRFEFGGFFVHCNYFFIISFMFVMF